MSRNPVALVDRRDFLRRAAASTWAIGGLGPASREWAAALTAGRAFEMVVLGDSIMWGQGHEDEQKFTYQVQQWLEACLPGTEVHRHVFAHSGARVAPDEREDAKPPTHGEVPNHFPSITAQVYQARRWMQDRELVDPAGVQLVLIDGGINDFGTKVILTPDPTVGVDWVRDVTRRKCVARLKGLLPQVLTAFPNAKVLVTNYFQIVSDQSDMVYLWELLRAWRLIGPAVNAVSEPLRRKLAAQSLAFHEESTLGFREAVAEAQPLEMIASPLAATGLERQSTSRALETRRLEPGRFALAEIPMGPQHAYGAPHTRLFYLNEPDPAANERKPACVALGKAADVNCLLAAAGHPNARGERIYADAIIKTIERWVSAWGGTLPSSNRRQPEPLIPRAPKRRR